MLLYFPENLARRLLSCLEVSDLVHVGLTTEYRCKGYENLVPPCGTSMARLDLKD